MQTDLNCFDVGVEGIVFNTYATNQDQKNRDTQVGIVGTDSSGIQHLVVIELTYSNYEVWKYSPTADSNALIPGGILSLGYDSFYWLSDTKIKSFSTLHSTGPI